MHFFSFSVMPRFEIYIAGKLWKNWMLYKWSQHTFSFSFMPHYEIYTIYIAGKLIVKELNVI